jgi:hypothetical protein
MAPASSSLTRGADQYTHDRLYEPLRTVGGHGLDRSRRVRVVGDQIAMAHAGGVVGEASRALARQSGQANGGKRTPELAPQGLAAPRPKASTWPFSLGCANAAKEANYEEDRLPERPWTVPIGARAKCESGQGRAQAVRASGERRGANGTPGPTSTPPRTGGRYRSRWAPRRSPVTQDHR